MGNNMATKATPVAKQATTTAVIQLTNKAPKFRQATPPAVNARQAWYNVLAQFNGCAVQAFTTYVQANPPTTPKRGKLAGKCEPPAGWLNWFTRNGFCKVVQVAKPKAPPAKVRAA